MAESQPLPLAGAQVNHPVADFDKWLKAFEADEPRRREAGILGHHINRAEDDPNQLMIYLALSDLDRARAFASDPALQAAMETAGVTAPPTIDWVRPIHVNVAWEGTHPAMFVTHSVADLDAWLTAYRAFDEERRSLGVIGDAANVSLDDDTFVTVLHQAESFDTLRALLTNPALLDAMEDAGVTSEPQVSFATGGWAGSYE